MTHETDMNPQTATVMGSAPFSTETTNTKVTDYVGNKIYEDGVLKKILVDGGYIDMETGEYHFYITDHLGNNRMVAKADGTVVQKNHYYPFGMEFAENSGDSDQPYKYNGKELDKMHGLNMYDYSARYYEPAIGRFTTVDPLAEEFYSISPYAYAMNNPIKYIDPRGDSAWSVVRDWNDTDIEGFSKYAEQRLKDYINKNINCADLALAVLIDYASENGLALSFETKDGRVFDSNSDSYNNIDDFKYGAEDSKGRRDSKSSVFTQVNAVDIPSNTFTVEKKDAQVGDMVILTAPAGHVVNYSKVPGDGSKRQLIYGNVGESVKRTGDWTNITKDSKTGTVYKYTPNNNVAHRWDVLRQR